MGRRRGFEKPQQTLKDYGTVGCTKEKIGKGKRLIVVDCITESGPVPGALWIFSETKSKKYGGPQVSRQNVKEASQQKLSRQKFVKATQKFVNNAAKVCKSHGKSL